MGRNFSPPHDESIPPMVARFMTWKPTRPGFLFVFFWSPHVTETSWCCVFCTCGLDNATWIGNRKSNGGLVTSLKIYIYIYRDLLFSEIQAGLFKDNGVPIIWYEKRKRDCVIQWSRKFKQEFGGPARSELIIGELSSSPIDNLWCVKNTNFNSIKCIPFLSIDYNIIYLYATCASCVNKWSILLIGPSQLVGMGSWYSFRYFIWP